MIASKRAKVLSCFLRSLAARLWKEDKDEDETSGREGGIEEEGGRVAERLLQVPEGLGDEEPAEVGGEVGQGVSPAAGPHWKHLGGHDPGEAAEAKVEGHCEAQDEGQRQPRDPATWTQDSLLLLIGK